MAHSVHVRLAGHTHNPERFHERIEASLTARPDGTLDIVYTIRGFNLDLRLPTPHAPAPAGALWRTSCCELFVGATGVSAYREFNFSPSGQWAVHHFSDTRQPLPGELVCPPPSICFTRGDDLLSMAVTLPKAALPKADTLRLAVAVVLEAEGGHHAYWALAHPPGKPDFHHHAGFVLSLGPAGFRPSHWL